MAQRIVPAFSTAGPPTALPTDVQWASWRHCHRVEAAWGEHSLDSMVGRTVGFGNYQLLGLLGRGGMGSVYEAEQLDLRRRMPVEVLHPALSSQRDFVE